MRLLEVGEPITVVHTGHSSLPQAFTWRAQQHRVWKIETFQDERVERAQGIVNRRVIKLRTHTGMRCSISYDEGKGRWRMDAVHPGGGLR